MKKKSKSSEIRVYHNIHITWLCFSQNFIIMFFSSSSAFYHPSKSKTLPSPKPSVVWNCSPLNLSYSKDFSAHNPPAKKWPNSIVSTFQLYQLRRFQCCSPALSRWAFLSFCTHSKVCIPSTIGNWLFLGRTTGAPVRQLIFVWGSVCSWDRLWISRSLGVGMAALPWCKRGYFGREILFLLRNETKAFKLKRKKWCFWWNREPGGL